MGDYAELLFGWSLLAEGAEPHDPVRFTQLVAGLMETGLGAAPAAAPPPAEAPDASDESGGDAETPAEGAAAGTDG